MQNYTNLVCYNIIILNILQPNYIQILMKTPLNFAIKAPLTIQDTFIIILKYIVEGMGKRGLAVVRLNETILYVLK